MTISYKDIMKRKIVALILAAGKGTRMKSDLNKNLHMLRGKEIIRYVIDAAKVAGANDIALIIGNDAEIMRERLGEDYIYVYQHEQLGTGHAVMQAEDFIKNNIDSDIMILLGDGPLITKESLEKMLLAHQDGADATLLTAVKENPFGYGRIIKSEEGHIEKIVEEKDASKEEKLVKEVWTGLSCYTGEALLESIKKIDNKNAQKEYYLTDTVKYLSGVNKTVKAVYINDEKETLNINDRLALSKAEKLLNQEYLEELMYSGVTIIDPLTTIIERDVKIGRDTTILPFTYLTGSSTIGMNCEVGPYTHLNNCEIGDNTTVNRSSLFSANIKNNATIGPYSYIRPNTVVENGAKVGQFVEVKNSIVGKNSKIPHLTYVGDTRIGERVNLGAGTIVVNYDGFNKYETIIEDDAFVGCNVNLVAPVRIGKGSLVAAGSTITKDVPSNALAIARSVQVNKDFWAKKRRDMRENLRK